MNKKTFFTMAVLALPLFFAACNGPQAPTACGDSFQKTDKDYNTNQLGIYLTRDPAFANGSYALGQGSSCADLGTPIEVTVSDDGNSVTIISGGTEMTGTWSDDDKSFSIPTDPPRTCFLALTKNTVNCLKGASYVCDTPSCTNVYTGP